MIGRSPRPRSISDRSEPPAATISVPREIIEGLVDDFDGGPAAETAMFGLDHHSSEIGLDEKNAAALAKLLRRSVEGGRLIRPVRSTSTTPTKDGKPIAAKQRAAESSVRIRDRPSRTRSLCRHAAGSP